MLNSLYKKYVSDDVGGNFWAPIGIVFMFSIGLWLAVLQDKIEKGLWHHYILLSGSLYLIGFLISFFISTRVKKEIEPNRKRLLFFSFLWLQVVIVLVGVVMYECFSFIMKFLMGIHDFFSKN